jgi:hypothetical protein
MTSMLRGLFLSAALTTTLALVGCGGTIEDNNSSQQCESSHQCTNGVCECTTEGKEGDACTDDDACVDECEVCS